MQDTGNPGFDMARNAAGRRQDISDPLLLNLNWNAPFFGSGTNACGVQPPLVCVSNHYVLGNMYRPQDAVHDSVRGQRPARIIGPRHLKSATSDLAASDLSGCSMPMK